eukprot:TRINITY_DN10473_c0_g1_i3.p6 TRINITY_DN10473_c0_g1~~TRINITY_DN10473_c0_g1_i3.p6  ORF type:complete len:123 (-),score=4.22 TRINITY_DN10473_c0_g1_i3:2136-2504(-)
MSQLWEQLFVEDAPEEAPKKRRKLTLRPRERPETRNLTSHSNKATVLAAFDAGGDGRRPPCRWGGLGAFQPPPPLMIMKGEPRADGRVSAETYKVPHVWTNFGVMYRGVLTGELKAHLQDYL